MADIIFKLDSIGGADILRNNQQLSSMENAAMNQVIANIEAQFFQSFGAEGRFELQQTMTDRRGVAIIPVTKQTRAILNAHPGWLATFINNIRI